MVTIDEQYAKVGFRQIYKKWQTCMRHVLLQSPPEREYTEQEFAEAVWDTHAMLRKLATEAIEGSGVRDELIQPEQMRISPLDQSQFIDSKKLGVRFGLGTDGSAMWLESAITRPEQLRYMDDEFFSLLLKLDNYGLVKFESNRVAFDKNVKSTIYKLVAAAQEEDLDEDFGRLSLNWWYTAPAEQLLAFVPPAFAVMHQLHYRLYRAEYQRGRRTSKRERSS